MRHKGKKLLAIFVLLLTILPVYAIKEVTDKWAIKALADNSGMIKVVEDEHNKELDSINAKQQKIMKSAGSMAVIKEHYRLSMQNVRGFGEESVYYAEMAKQFAMIPGNTLKALKAMKKSPFINYINSLDEIANIQLDAVSIIQTFVDVVNNGKVSLSGFTSDKNDNLTELLESANVGNGDGYNFLDRYERLSLCCTLIGQITSINMRLQNIAYVCEYCSSIRNALFNLDPYSWIDIMTGVNIVDNIVNDWNWEMKGWV